MLLQIQMNTNIHANPQPSWNEELIFAHTFGG